MSDQPTYQMSMFSALVSHASQQATQESDVGQVTNVGSGEKQSASSRKSNPGSFYSKTYPVYGRSSAGIPCAKSLGYLPKSGLMLCGHIFALPTLALRNIENASLLWPTPNASDNKRISKGNYFDSRRVRRGGWDNLTEAIVTVEGTGAGYINPRWEECLMGYPDNWTQVDGLPDPTNNNTHGNLSGNNQPTRRVGRDEFTRLETRLYRKLCSQSRKQSAPTSKKSIRRQAHRLATHPKRRLLA